MNNKFFREYIHDISQSPLTIKHCSKYILTKSLKEFFNNMHIYDLSDNQLFDILLKIKLNNGSIMNISTLKRVDKNSLLLLSTLYKELLNRRADEVHGFKVINIIYVFHIYKINESLTNENNLLSEYPFNTVEVKILNKINYINQEFKLPLSYAGTINFLLEFMKLNTNVNNVNSNDHQYKIDFENISINEILVKIQSQDNNELKYSFIDKLITVPKLYYLNSIIERKVVNENNCIYLIDMFNNSVILINNLIDKEGISIEKKKPKIITFDIKFLNHNNNNIPILISYVDFKRHVGKYKILNLYNPKLDDNYSLIYFFNNFLSHRYNGYIIFTQNTNLFKSFYVLKIIEIISRYKNLKIIKKFKGSDLISIKVKYGFNVNRKYFKYQIEFRNSYNLTHTPLNQLAHIFLKESEIQINLTKQKELISEIQLNPFLLEYKFYNKKLVLFSLYENLLLANILYNFNLKTKINIINYNYIPKIVVIYLLYLINPPTFNDM